MLSLFRTEMVKQWRRPRTYLVLALTVLIPIIIAIAVKANPPSLSGDRGPEERFISFATSTGLFLPVAALQFMSRFLLVIIVTLFAGDAVASEASWGNLRAVLTRPVGRGRLLGAKLGSAGTMAVVATVLIGLTGLVVGTIVFGWHPLNINSVAIAGRTIPTPGAAFHQSQAHVIGNLALASGYVLWSITGVAALAFMVSTMTDSPSSAVFAGFGLYVVSQILGSITSLGTIRYVLPTYYFDAWQDLFRGSGPTADMLRGTLLQIGYVVLFLGIAWRYFRRKDILS